MVGELFEMGNRITKSNYKLCRTYTVFPEKTQLRKRSVTELFAEYSCVSAPKRGKRRTYEERPDDSINLVFAFVTDFALFIAFYFPVTPLY